MTAALFFQLSCWHSSASFDLDSPGQEVYISWATEISDNDFTGLTPGYMCFKMKQSWKESRCEIRLPSNQKPLLPHQGKSSKLFQKNDSLLIPPGRKTEISGDTNVASKGHKYL